MAAGGRKGMRSTKANRSSPMAHEGGMGRFDQICEEYVSALRRIHDVDAVFTYSDEQLLFLWTIVNVRDERTNRAIAHANDQLRTKYIDVDFDFDVLQRRGRPLEEIEPGGFRRFYVSPSLKPRNKRRRISSYR